MTAIRILLHYTPAGVLEALGKVEEEEERMFMVCYGYVMDTLVKSLHLPAVMATPMILDLQTSNLGETRELSR